MKMSRKHPPQFLLFTTVLILSTTIIFSLSSQQLSQVFQIVNAVSSSTATGLNQQASSSTNDSVSSLNIKDIFKDVQGSIVQITRKVPTTNPNIPSQQPGGEANRTALGSGFVYDKQGHVVTNNHVVGNARTVDITLIDGNRYTANVTGTDPYSDLAALKIITTSVNSNSNTTNGEKRRLPSSLLLKPLTLGNSSALEVGDQVIAIGNPYGLDNTMTTGIVSQVGRAIQTPAGAYSIPDIIQTDTAINPGNSGGPLLNMQGQVIGITFGGIPGGINFAIPSNTIKKIVPILIGKGSYSHPSLGISIGDLTSDLASRFNKLPSNLKGVVVNTIVKDRSADKAGVKGSTTDQYGQKHGGDIITAVDGKNVTRSDDLISYLDLNKSPGNNVTLTVYRDGKYVHVNVILGQRPSLQSIVPYPTQPSPPPPPTIPKPPTMPPAPPSPPIPRKP
jgi:S1-C subfamily serine protease